MNQETRRELGILGLFTPDIPLKNFDEQTFWRLERFANIAHSEWGEDSFTKSKKQLDDVVNRNVVVQQFLPANEVDTNTKNLRGSMMGKQPFIRV